MKRMLLFKVEIPADVTPFAGESQEKADAETTQMILPALQTKLDRYPGNARIVYAGSEDREEIS